MQIGLGENMEICLCMIVKNEEEYLKMCLENAFHIADRAVVVDTGSTDRTIDILQEFGSKVEIRRFEWNNDFSVARNFSLEGVTSDWILILDADEKFICDSQKLRNELRHSAVDGYDILLEGYVNGGAALVSTVYGRLFRNKGYRYYRAIHEQINLDQDKVKHLDESVGKIIHYGYSDSIMKNKEKTKRNLAILLSELEKNLEDAFLYYHIGATYGAMKEYKLSLHYYLQCLELSGKTGVASYHSNLFKRMALTYYELEMFEECTQFIDRILQNKAYERFVDLFYIKGLCLKKLKHYEEAEQVFIDCIIKGDNKGFPSVFGRGSFLARLELARVYQEEGKVASVVPSYVEAVLDPNNVCREGLDEFRNYLQDNKLSEIEAELKRLLNGDKS